MSVLTMYRGDDVSFAVTALDAAGDPVDLTDAVLTWTAKASHADTDAAAFLVKTTDDSSIVVDADPKTGVATIVIDAADTDTLVVPMHLFWDLQLELSGKIATLATGTLDILLDVTQAGVSS